MNLPTHPLLRTPIPLDPGAVASARLWFAAKTLGVGVFVSAYFHALAVPIVYYAATHESVELFAPRKDRASIELTLSMPSRARESSAEMTLREPRRLPETRRIEESDSNLDAPRTLDLMTAAPVNFSRPGAAPAAEPIADRPELPRDAPMDLASANVVAPLPLIRRQDSTESRNAEELAQTHAVARSPTADSPSQIASEIRLGAEAETMPELVDNPPPVYPPDALREGVEGRVVVLATIDRTGEAVQASIHESSGTPSLDRAAKEAVLHWRFRPALRFGLAVEMSVGVPVDFSIRDAKANASPTVQPDAKTDLD